MSGPFQIRLDLQRPTAARAKAMPRRTYQRPSIPLLGWPVCDDGQEEREVLGSFVVNNAVLWSGWVLPFLLRVILVTSHYKVGPYAAAL